MAYTGILGITFTFSSPLWTATVCWLCCFGIGVEITSGLLGIPMALFWCILWNFSRSVPIGFFVKMVLQISKRRMSHIYIIYLSIYYILIVLLNYFETIYNWYNRRYFFKYFDIYSTYHMFYRYIESHIHIFMGPNITREKNLFFTSINPLVFFSILHCRIFFHFS